MTDKPPRFAKLINTKLGVISAASCIFRVLMCDGYRQTPAVSDVTVRVGRACGQAVAHTHQSYSCTCDRVYDPGISEFIGINHPVIYREKKNDKYKLIV